MPVVLVSVFFFLSGACGLVFENTWTRLLRLVMGNTVFSVTTVLCAFMGGLAVGSYLGGKWIDRRKDALKVYASLEGGIGLYCLLLPWLIPAVEPFYRYIYQHFHTSFYAFSLLRFLFSVLILLIPATFMGATFPILSKWFLQREDRIGLTIGKLYALNSFGAVLGALAGGFLLIPTFGIAWTIYLTAGVNLFICLGIFLLYLREPAGVTAPAQPLPESRSELLKFLLIGYGLAGLSAMMYEVAWTRVLSLLIGSSVYAFSLMLTAFIFGLAAGSLAYSPFIDRKKDPIFSLALIEMGIGISALVAVPLLGRLPFTVVKLVSRFSESFWLLQLTEFGMILAVILVPTFLMGAAFPLITRICTPRLARAGRSVGNVYAANTLGSIAGAFCGGFILIPWVGIQKTLLIAVLVNIFIGGLFLILAPSVQKVKKIAFIGAVAAMAGITAFLIPSWDQAVITSGAYLYADQFTRFSALSGSTIERNMKRARVIFYQEDVSTTVTVRQTPTGERTLAINGKSDASSSGDLPTQALLAHGPLLLHPNPKRALVIGLASGITLGTAGRYPLEKLDCVEISSAVVQASHIFDDLNGHILSDPRVELIVSDGRNHLALTDRNYDVIISEPTNPWIAGISDLFTREYFDLCRRRLNPGGIACVWLQAYDTDEEIFKSIAHTFNTVFPHMILMETIPMDDYVLIGSENPFQVDYETLCRRMGQPAVAKGLRNVDIRTPTDFFARIVLNEKGISEYAGSARPHTDDLAFAEFSAPRKIYNRGIRGPLIENLNRQRKIDLSFLTFGSAEKNDAERIKSDILKKAQATKCAVEAVIFFEQGKHNEAVRLAGQAAQLNPNGFPFLNEMSENLILQALAAQKQNNPAGAAQYCQTAVELTPTFFPAQAVYGTILTRQGKWAQAAAAFRNALKIEPDDDATLNHLAWLLATSPDAKVRNGREALAMALDLCGTEGAHNPNYLRTLAAAYAETAQFPQAIKIAQAALKLARDAADINLMNSLELLLKNYQDGKPFYQ